jgi:hypothetical protein
MTCSGLRGGMPWAGSPLSRSAIARRSPTQGMVPGLHTSGGIAAMTLSAPGGSCRSLVRMSRVPDGDEEALRGPVGGRVLRRGCGT